MIFAVLTAFSFFGVLFYLSKMEMLEELNEDENIFGELKNFKMSSIERWNPSLIIDLLFLKH